MSLRPWQIWLAFATSLALAVGALGWISATTLSLDAREAEARRLAQEEENIRLALWRMDSAIAPIVSMEAARPYFAYAAFYDLSAPYGQMMGGGEDLVASPLLTEPPPQARLHFQLERDGRISSPQAPRGRHAARAEALVGAERYQSATARLTELESKLTKTKLTEALRLGREREAQADKDEDASEEGSIDRVYAQVTQAVRNTVESKKREKVAKQAAASTGYFKNPIAFDDKVTGGEEVRIEEGAMSALWVEDLLLLARSVQVGEVRHVQGVWLGWPEVRALLLAEVRDLLPNADLLASAGGASARSMAALPVELIPGSIPAPRTAVRLSVILTLGAAWAAALLAVGAIALLLFGATSLSERRADFVSAVTHELRTPLTTFRMYTEMLAEGMVDEDKRARYLDTLKKESARLAHLVENVLAYARIERGRDASKRERFSIAERLGPFGDRLRERASQAGMSLELRIEDASAIGDPAALEQIVYNLVDNACKYAASAADRRIHLSAARDGGEIVVRVRDHGPGVSAEDRRRLFSAFSKSAHRAAMSAPGVGLGLALSRRLARAMGGELSYETAEGACFVLRLPVG